MAAVAALRTYSRDPIGLGMDATGTLRADAIINEGIGASEDLVDLHEEDGIKTLCHNVRKPVGTLPDPAWLAPAPHPMGLVAPQIPTPGQKICYL